MIVSGSLSLAYLISTVVPLTAADSVEILVSNV